LLQLLVDEVPQTPYRGLVPGPGGLLSPRPPAQDVPPHFVPGSRPCQEILKQEVNVLPNACTTQQEPTNNQQLTDVSDATRSILRIF